MKKYLLLILLLMPLTILGSPKVVKLSKCIDGDTASFLDGKKEIKVRFLAINAPEYGKKKNEPFGKDAANFTCNALKKAQLITLEYDKKNKKDKYGRDLAWIFYDGKLLQEELIRRGYAEVAYVYGKYAYTGRIKAEQSKAKAAKIGIWSLDKPYKESKKEENFILKLLASITELLKALERLLKRLSSLLKFI